MLLTRRQVLSGVSLFAAGCAASPKQVAVEEPPTPHGPSSPFAAIEEGIGGRVGVLAVDTANGRLLAHREDERFAMCSTFKWALAAAVLHAVDDGELALDHRIAFSADDVLEYAPMARKHVAEGGMSVEALAAAAVTLSDNTAANLLLPLIGGPEGLTAFFRSVGDEVSRLDRNEPTLNTNIAGDPRDTTTPRAMAGALQNVLVGDVLQKASRDRLIAWLVGCETCGERLRAGFPEGWRVGDKTGTGTRGAVNDVAIAWPPGRPPLIVTAYFSGSDKSVAEMSAAHAAIAKTVVLELAS